MRPKIAIGILFFFCFAEIKPLLPIIEYYLNYKYISEVLCINKDKPMSTCNGKCYLNKQVEKEQKTEEPDKTIPKIEWEKIPMIFYENKLSSRNKDLNAFLKHLFSYEFSLKIVFISPPTPPPEN